MDEISKLAAKGQPIDLDPIRASLKQLDLTARRYEQAVKSLQQENAVPPALAGALEELNRTLYQSERAFKHDVGLPRREWFKHVAYAPGFYTGYGVKTLPGIREGIEEKHFDEARAFVPIIAGAIDRLRASVEKATALLINN